jgi:hypothetical protein
MQPLDVQITQSPGLGAGEWVKKRKLEADDEPDEEDFEVVDDDVAFWIGRFEKGQWGSGDKIALTNEMLVTFVQKLEDVLSSYIDRLELLPADDDDDGGDDLDRLGGTVHKLLQKLKGLKLEHFAKPLSERETR